MKKIVSLLLCAMLAAMVAGCSNSDKKAETSKGKTSTGNRTSRSRRKKNTDNNDNK